MAHRGSAAVRGEVADGVVRIRVAAPLRLFTRRAETGAPTYADFFRCADCARVYWRGAHARSLDAFVARHHGPAAQ